MFKSVKKIKSFLLGKIDNFETEEKKLEGDFNKDFLRAYEWSVNDIYIVKFTLKVLKNIYLSIDETEDVNLEKWIDDLINNYHTQVMNYSPNSLSTNQSHNIAKANQFEAKKIILNILLNSKEFSK